MDIHERFGGLADLHVLGGLGAEERQEVERHAEACGECGDRFRRAREFVSRISQAVAPDAPPEDLEGRILDHLGGSEPPGFLDRHGTGLRRVARWTVAAAVLASLIFLGAAFPAFSGVGSEEECMACIVRPQWPLKVYPPELKKDQSRVLPHPDPVMDCDDSPATPETGFRGRALGGKSMLFSPGFSSEKAVPAQVREDRRIIRRAQVDLEVDSCEAVQKKIAEMVSAAKGFMAGNDHHRLPNGKWRATVTLRVPPEAFEPVLDKVRTLGNVLRQTLSTQDVTKTWVDLEARLSTKEALLERLKKVLAEAKGTVRELMEAEAQMGKVVEELESVKGELKYYENLVALATIVLDIFEKDLGQPFEYVQTLESTMGVSVLDADGVMAKAQEVILEAGGLIADSKMIRKGDGRATGSLRGRVDADKFPGVRERIKALGHVTADGLDRHQSSKGGTREGPSGDIPVRKEMAVIDLTVSTPPIAVTRTAEFGIETPEVEKAYLAARQAVVDAGGRIIEGTLTGGGDYAKAQVKARVGIDKYPDLVTRFKALGKVRTDRAMHQLPVESGEALEPPYQEEAVVNLTLNRPVPEVPQESVIGRRVRDTVSNSFEGLTWSVEKLFVGICLAGPWAGLGILGWVFYRLYCRRKAARAAAPDVTAP